MNKEVIEEQIQYIRKVKEMMKNEKKYYNILTMGCQLNENDSEKLAGMLEEMGYKPAKNGTVSDIYILNTCCVRENAEEKLFGKVGELKKIKQKNNSIIAVCGCMMQEKHMQDKLKESYPYIDIIFGTHTLHKFPEDLYKVISEKNKIKDILDIDGEIYEGLPIKRNSNKSASVTIMYGCNNFCSYCIVPYVRGRERSREPKEIIREIEKLVNEGVIEVMLLGQNVNSYGKNLDNPMSFAELLKEIEKIDGLKRIRFMTSHPKDLSDDLIEVMAKSEKICKHIHLPLQSGSDRVLKEMNRRYTKEQYLSLVEKIKKAIPDVAVTTDIIVGFPGETAADVDDTIDVIRKVHYDNAFTFIYSKRTGTPAAARPDQCDEAEVKANFDRVLNAVKEEAMIRNGYLVGRVEEALVEEINAHDDAFVTGRLSNNSMVHFKGDASLIGKLVKVNILEAKGFYYMGEMI